LFHELPPEASRRVLEETFRVLRPGGALTILDFTSVGDRDVYNMWFAEMDSKDNGEPYLPLFVRSNIEKMIAEVGFKMEPYDPKNSLRTGRVCVKPLQQ
ncbi:MAG TPA: hypothetical protein PK159_14395, partial [Steroidobacteraceae bacterium]|nr:hypothetical protein [Steroidobacteraceae bacterium]